MANPDYGTMSWDQLLNLRNAIAPDDPAQNVLGPYEHQAYARETTENSPILGPIQMALAIPAYAAARKMGVLHGRSDPSWDSILAGYRGVGQGIQHNMHPLVTSLYRMLNEAL